MLEEALQSLKTRDGRRKFFDDFDKTYGHILNTEKGKQATLLLLDLVTRSDRLVRHVFFRRCIQRLKLPKTQEVEIYNKLNLGRDTDVMRSEEYRELVGRHGGENTARGSRLSKSKRWWERIFG